MRPASAAALVVSVSFALSTATTETSARADEWLGRDKALHFGASAVIAGGGYAIGTALFDSPRPPEGSRAPAFAFGAGLALGAGLAKEALDAAGMGDPSWKDLAWDVLGTAVGLGVAWSIDRIVRPAPTTSTAPRVNAPLVIRF